MACDSFFPADLLLLASANADGTAYVETINLDGESNLKIKKALDATRHFSLDTAARLQARLSAHEVHGILGRSQAALCRAAFDMAFVSWLLPVPGRTWTHACGMRPPH